MYLSLSKSFRHFVLLSVFISQLSCTGEMMENMKTLPYAFGDINMLAVIGDENILESPIADSILFYYASSFPILPQPEPMLDLRFLKPADLTADPLRKQFRTYLLLGDLGNPESATTKMMVQLAGEASIEEVRRNPTSNIVIGKDKWARDQVLILQFAQNREELLQNLKKNAPGIIRKVYDHDKFKIDATVYLSKRNPKLEQEVRDKIGINIEIPGDYFQALSDGEVIWFRKETPETSSNLMFRKIPYTDKKQLSREGLKAIRDSIGLKYVSSRIQGSYMKINDEDLPMFVNPVTFNGQYALEARGIWEIENDYMGGAFVSYLILNPVKNELIFLDGFLHAPGEEKRNFVQYMDHILHTAKIL
jgi:hypothetical protein